MCVCVCVHCNKVWFVGLKIRRKDLRESVRILYYPTLGVLQIGIYFPCIFKLDFYGPSYSKKKTPWIERAKITVFFFFFFYFIPSSQLNVKITNHRHGYLFKYNNDNIRIIELNKLKNK